MGVFYLNKTFWLFRNFFTSTIKMRPLTGEETKIMFKKLSNYIGENIKNLIERPDGAYCFRLHRDRVYYVSVDTMKMAASISHDCLSSLGVCFGKFTKTRKFMMKITALDYLSPYAKYKVWVKPSAEQSFLYGNHIQKAGVGRITEGTPKYSGVVVFSMGDVALGFGVAAKTPADIRKTEPMGICVFWQSDLGEYLRNEDLLT